MMEMTDEQIDSVLSAMMIQPIDGVVETLKTVGAKTPLELQANVLCSAMQNPKELPSENWMEAIFDSVESLLGKNKVKIARTTFDFY